MRHRMFGRGVIYAAIAIGSVLLLVRCGSKSPESVVVARIGDRLITGDEFAYAYELAPRSLTEQDKRAARRAVLDRLTDRILLAREAEELGLGETDSVLQRALDLYKRKAVNRELYRKYIRNPITITEQEEREAFAKSKITYFVKHFSDTSADAARDVFRGTVAFEHIPLFPGVQTVEKAPFGRVDVLPWRSIPADVETLVVNLPLYQRSEPFFDGTTYHVFEVVDREREVLVREHDFQAQRESLHGILKRRKEAVAASRFVQDIMKPQGLIIKARALNDLTDYLWERRPVDIKPKANYLGGAEIQYISQRDSDLGREPLALFRDGRMTVADILFQYKVNPQPVSYDSKLALRESLKNATALFVRDWVFSEKGIAEKLDRKPAVQAELRTRREYLLAEKMVNRYYRDVAGANMPDSDFQKLLMTHIGDLKNEADIQIDEHQLMAVNTSDEGLTRKIDFIAVQTE